jgi:hypothetical protein
MRRCSSFGSFASASFTASARAVRISARLISAARFGAAIAWPSVGVAEESKVRIAGKRPRCRKPPSGYQTQPSPRCRLASEFSTSLPAARSPQPLIQSSTASRSCGASTRMATSVSAEVRVSLCSFCGRCVISARRMPRERPPLASVFAACSILPVSGSGIFPFGAKLWASSSTRCSGALFSRYSVVAKSMNQRVRSPTVSCVVSATRFTPCSASRRATAAPPRAGSGRSPWSPPSTRIGKPGPFPSREERSPHHAPVGSTMPTRRPSSRSGSTMAPFTANVLPEPVLPSTAMCWERAAPGSLIGFILCAPFQGDGHGSS